MRRKSLPPYLQNERRADHRAARHPPGNGPSGDRHRAVVGICRIPSLFWQHGAAQGQTADRRLNWHRTPPSCGPACAPIQVFGLPPGGPAQDKRGGAT